MVLRSLQRYYKIQMRLPRNVASYAACALTGLVVLPPVVALAGALFYAGTVLAGVVVGHALPAASIFSFFPSLRKFVVLEVYLPQWILAWAALGATWSWIASSRRSPLHMLARPAEVFIARLLRRCGLFLCLMLFTLYLGSLWSGIPRIGDMYGSSVAGLMPWNDAAGYWVYSYLQQITGKWSEFCTRRPVAAALRSAIIFVSGGTYPNALLLQAWLLALSTWLVSSALSRWRNTWVGVGFLGFFAIGARPFIGTVLTEPIGLVWTLLGLVLLISTLRRFSIFSLGMGMVGVTMGLLTRMGAMFVLPALFLWTGWCFRKAKRSCCKALCVLVIALLLCLGISQTLKSLYGQPQMLGANFGSVLCGLTMGTSWDGPYRSYRDELSSLKTEKDQAVFLYGKAFENFKQNPSILFRRLGQGLDYFATNMVSYIFGGYAQIQFTEHLFQWISIVLIFGWGLLFFQRLQINELFFHVLVLGGIFASAPIVIFDDGWRVLVTGFPFVWLIVSCGFYAPSCILHYPGTEIRASNPIWAAAIIICLLFASLIFPGVAHYSNTPLPDLEHYKTDDATGVIRGGKAVSGFLVVQDGQPLPGNVPSISFSGFKEILAKSGIEQYQPMITQELASTSFTITLAPVVTNNLANGLVLIGPPEMLLRKDVAYWQVSTGPWPPNSSLQKSNYWRSVLDARPIGADGNSLPW